MQKQNLVFIVKTLTISADKIGFFRSLLEACDNLAILTTVDEKQGLVALRYPEGNTVEVEEMLGALPDHLALVPVDVQRCH